MAWRDSAITRKFAHRRSMVPRRGRKCRRQQLSWRGGVARSDGNSQSSELLAGSIQDRFITPRGIGDHMMRR